MSNGEDSLRSLPCSSRSCDVFDSIEKQNKYKTIKKHDYIEENIKIVVLIGIPEGKSHDPHEIKGRSPRKMLDE